MDFNRPLLKVDAPLMKAPIELYLEKKPTRRSCREDAKTF